MPLFGKKKNEKKEMSGKPSYPTQGGYPTQGASAPPPQQGAYGPPPPQNMYGPPPPYGQPPPYQQYPGGPQPMNPPHPGMYGPQPVQPPQPMYVQQGAFDAGARFDGVAQPNVPPPPPGCMPNAAQLAAANGQPAVVTQNKKSFWTGGSDGGYVVW